MAGWQVEWPLHHVFCVLLFFLCGLCNGCRALCSTQCSAVLCCSVLCKGMISSMQDEIDSLRRVGDRGSGGSRGSQQQPLRPKKKKRRTLGNLMNRSEVRSYE